MHTWMNANIFVIIYMYLKYSFIVYYLIFTIVICKHIDKLHAIELFTTYNSCSNNVVANDKESTHLNIGLWQAGYTPVAND